MGCSLPPFRSFACSRGGGAGRPSSSGFSLPSPWVVGSLLGSVVSLPPLLPAPSLSCRFSLVSPGDIPSALPVPVWFPAFPPLCKPLQYLHSHPCHSPTKFSTSEAGHHFSPARELPVSVRVPLGRTFPVLESQAPLGQSWSGSARPCLPLQSALCRPPRPHD